MWYIGVDAHKRRCFLTAKNDEDDRRVTRVFDHTPDGWRTALAAFPPGSQVAIECVGWYQPIFDLLNELGYQGHLVHAKDVTLIGRSKRKTDARDSEILVDLLRTGFLPESHVPGLRTRQLREMTRHLDDVVRRMTAAKNRIHRLLERAWVSAPDVSDLFGAKGRAFLDCLRLEPAKQLVLRLLMREYDALLEIRLALEAEIARFVQDDNDVLVLMSIQGVSVIGAATLSAEFDDVSRFPNRSAIRSNFGMAVSVRDSADTERRGHITKQGPGIVRKILVQGATHFARRDPRASRKYERLATARGRSVARVAAAGTLLSTAYQMLKTGTLYKHADPARLEMKRRELARMARRPPPSYLS